MLPYIPYTRRIVHWLRISSRLSLLVLSVSMLSGLAHGQDFANLKRYQTQNTRLIDTGQQIEIVIMGDSITDRWPQQRPHFFKETGWIGRGIVGETTAQMLLRFRQDVIELEPKIVVILAGTNDIAGNSGSIRLETTLGHLKSMVDLARSYDIQPVLCTVLPAAKYPWSEEKRPDLEIPKLNVLLRTYADTAGIPVVNFYSVMTDGNGGMRTALSDDGVHPNNLGYAVMERRLEAALNPQITKTPNPN